MESIVETFRKNLRAALKRVQPQMGQREVAERAGITTTTIQAWLNDENRSPKLDNVESIARVLGVDPLKMISDREPKTSPQEALSVLQEFVKNASYPGFLEGSSGPPLDTNSIDVTGLAPQDLKVLAGMADRMRKARTKDSAGDEKIKTE